MAVGATPIGDVPPMEGMGGDADLAIVALQLLRNRHHGGKLNGARAAPG